MKIKAVWGTEYDYKSDECYECPICPECHAPIFKCKDNYICISCTTEMIVDEDMQKWIDEREGIKTEEIVCLRCKGKLRINYFKNHRTAEWETGTGECLNCGMKFIV